MAFFQSAVGTLQTLVVALLNWRKTMGRKSRYSEYARGKSKRTVAKNAQIFR